MDDLPIVIAFFRLLSIKLDEGRLYLLQQPVFYVRMQQQVIRSDAGLPRIGELPQDNTPGRRFNIGVALHNNRALPPQLKRDGHQVQCGQLVDSAAYGNTAGEKNMVEPER